MTQAPKLNKFLLLFSAIFLFVGIIITAVGIINYVSGQNFKKTAVESESVITEISRYRDYSGSDSGSNYSYEVYVAYTANGAEYESKLNEWNSGMYEGQKITIFYNPENPQEFRTDSNIFSIIFVSLGSLCILVGAITLGIMLRNHAARKKLVVSGRQVMAEITDIIRSNVKVNNRYGSHIICERVDETGMICRYKSEAIWSNPAGVIERMNITKLPVYLDEDNEKNYYVDISRLSECVKDLT